MGLAANTAFVTAADVAAITQETGLANLDAGDANATLANALVQATNAIMRELRIRGVVPENVQNTDDLKAAAAWWIAWRKYHAAPLSGPQGDVAQRKAESYKKLFDDEIARVVIAMTALAAQQTAAPKGMPRTFNFDADWYNRRKDNRVPQQPPDAIWESK